MVSLKDRKWKEFFVGDIANIESGSNISSDDREEGKIPYITASFNNNGVTDFISNRESVDRNFISVNSNGSIGYSFYHKYKSICSNDCRKLNLKTSNNEYVSLFITNQISCQRDKYNYGYKMGTKRLQRQYIMLPVTDEGEPDWIFMQDYIKQLESNQKEEYKNFATKKLQDLEYKEIPTLKEKTWKAFFISDIFTISSGKRLTKLQMDAGKVPFIGSTDSNNGITNWVSTINESYDKNVLGVNYNGSVAESFFHGYSCIFSDDVKRLHLKHYEDNKFVLLFFKTIILQQKSKYRHC